MRVSKYYVKPSYLKGLVIIGLGTVTVVGLSSQTVVEAVMDFCFAGIVPGTNIVIDPQTMLLGQTVIVGMIIAALLLNMLVSRIWYRRSVAAGMSEVHHVEPKHNTQKRQLSAVVLESKIEQENMPKDYKALNLSIRYLKLLSGHSTKLIGAVAKILKRLTAQSIVIGLTTAEAIRSSAVMMWQVVRPYAERFDTWLEVHFRHTTAYLASRAMRSERIQVIVLMVRESRQTIRQRFK